MGGFITEGISISNSVKLIKLSVFFSGTYNQNAFNLLFLSISLKYKLRSETSIIIIAY